MKRTMLTLSTLVSGFLGGFACNYMVNGFTAAAQTDNQRQRQPLGPIHGQGFVLEDAKGAKRGEFALDSKGNGVLTLYNRYGQLTWSSNSGVMPLRVSPESFR